jgi:hypothetical protein
MLQPGMEAGGPVVPSYRVYLLSDAERIVGRGDFASRDDAAAMTIAELVSVTSRDPWASYELWREDRKISAGTPSPTLPLDQFDDHIRQAKADAELALIDSRWRIAEGWRLLEAV